MFLIAQPFSKQGESVPGAATDDSPVAAYVHGQFFESACCGDEVETYDDEGNRLTLRNMDVSGTVGIDDPRLRGNWSITQHVDEFAQPDTDERVEVWWGDIRIENEGGAWSGTVTTTCDSEQPIETDPSLPA